MSLNLRINDYTIKSQIATTQDLTLEELSKEPSFRSNVETSIASSIGVNDEYVAVTGVDVASRRLEALTESVDISATRRLKNALLKIDYEVYTTGDLERNRIRSRMTSDDDFASIFLKELQEKEEASGRSLSMDDVKVAVVDVNERTVSIADARLAAKEEVAARSPSRTSTTRKTITIKSAGSTTVAPEDDISMATTSSPCEMIPPVWLVMLVGLASLC